MCRSADYQKFHSSGGDRLKIKAFFIQFSRLQWLKQPLPQSLTLLYLPRIDETVLEIDGTKIRPDSPAFVTLHRVVSSSSKKDVVFGSRERVRASEGVQFQVYLKEEKVVQGIFRKDDDGEWKTECKCTLEKEMAGAEASQAVVCVDVEGHIAMFEKIELRVRRKKNRRFGRLEEIPERREVGIELDGCCSSCGENGSASDDEVWEDGEGNEWEMEVEGVGWAVDLGIWAVCLGVGLGYLASKAASAKSLRRRRLI